MTDVPTPEAVSRPQSGNFSMLARHIAFGLFAVLIYLGPAPGQIFGSHSPWLREWVMFSGVGVGIPNGRFVVRHEDGAETMHTPLEAADIEQYPLILHYLFENRIFATEHFTHFAAPLCATAPETSSVRFEGAVGTRQGWQALKIENICASSEGEQP